MGYRFALTFLAPHLSRFRRAENCRDLNHFLCGGEIWSIEVKKLGTNPGE